MQVWVGTSGYAYGDWVGDFYPRQTPAGRMLPEYARHFPLVELNYTFYRLPTPEELVRLVRKAPEGFQFLVKLHQSLSHEHDLGQAGLFRAAVDAVRAEGKLLGLLCQYPQRFHDDPPNRQRLERLAAAFAGHTLAVEFRHVSWARPEVPAWLAGRGLHLVSVDAPHIPALYPSGLVQSSRLIYVRFHSRRAVSWYEGDKERYDYLYSDDELKEWLGVLAAGRDRADRALLLFNNCHRAQAAQNALRVQELLKELAREDFELVLPFAPPQDKQHQRNLFS
jgi:uncharacterized protein YecE (DUF72 family)